MKTTKNTSYEVRPDRHSTQAISELHPEEGVIIYDEVEKVHKTWRGGELESLGSSSVSKHIGLVDYNDTSTASTPIQLVADTWTEITSLTNADLAPSAFTSISITVDELSAVNVQLHPADAPYTTSIADDGGSGLTIDSNGVHLQGTAPEVTGDYNANPSDTYTITVRRTNTYGSVDGTLTLVVTNLTAPVITPITGFTHNASSTALIDADTMDDGSVVAMDEQLRDLERLVILRAFVETNILPSLTQVGDKYIIGALNTGADVSSLDVADYDVAIVWEYETASSHTFKFYKDGGLQQNIVINSMTQAFYDYAIELNDTSVWLIACNANAINTEPSPEYGGTFSNATEFTLGETAPLTISFGYSGASSADFDTTGLSEIVTPAPSDWIQVTASPSHTLQFDGSGTMPTLQAGYTYRFLMGDTVYADLSTSSGLHTDDILRFTADGSTEYTTGITRVGAINATDTFGAHTAYVEFVVPNDVPPLQWYTEHNGIGSANGIAISGSTYVQEVTGIDLEGSSVGQTGTNLFDAGKHGWASIDETLSAGERIVFSNAFLIDLIDAMPDNSLVSFGLKDTDWDDGDDFNTGFVGGARFTVTRYSSGDIRFYSYKTHNNVTISSNIYYSTVALVASNNVSAFLELTSTGNNVRSGYRGDNLVGTLDPNNTAYANWTNGYKVQTGDEGFGLTTVDVVVQARSTDFISGAMDSNDVDWTLLNEITIPTPPVTNSTPWAKALDFGGSNEHAMQISNNPSVNPLQQQVGWTVNPPVTIGNTTADLGGRPWATVVVFKADGNNTNQHIWNYGEGGGNSTNDNIYLRLDSNRNLHFGWGRDGALNECSVGHIGGNIGGWWSVYIGYNGARFSGANATSTNLANTFDIRLTSNASSWVAGSDRSTISNWVTTGGRMDRAIISSFCVGGRYNNRSFHGKVASMVVTTLPHNVAMPDATEIEMMIQDPKKWLQDYKVGNAYRFPSSTGTTPNFQLNNGGSSYSTQVWLMGDGTNDSYSNMIRNQVAPNDQNYTKLNLISMVSNDIENVNINGLS